MDNKELPKEVIKKVNSGEGLKSWSEEQEYELFSATHGAQIAHDYYAPIIEGKDKEIAEAWAARHEWFKATGEANKKKWELQKELSEKDKRIAELEAEAKKVMGLLKELHGELCLAVYKPSDDEWRQKRFDEYRKEHSLTYLGGE